MTSYLFKLNSPHIMVSDYGQDDDLRPEGGGGGGKNRFSIFHIILNQSCWREEQEEILIFAFEFEI